MYCTPASEIAFTLKHVAGMAEGLAAGVYGDLTEDVVDAIIQEAAKFADTEIAPLNIVGDRQPARVKDGVVTMPPGWVETYRNWCAAGWNGLTGGPEWGGQGLPVSLSAATQEMWNAANMGFAIGPTLTVAAIEALEAHASDALKRTYLPKLVSGEWFGTMNLTEPQAGSDLGALKTRAEPVGDGSYRLFGQKIFITYGEHDLTENIIHMVLARLPDAPEGTKGISLFLVPKFLVEADGSLGARNDVWCHSVEHKMGIHGSPTCVMLYGDGKAGGEPGAIGWLVGEPHKGLAAMFTMMNNARLMVGVQGVGVAERALQRATAYAKERRQGRGLKAGKAGPMVPIIEHADVRQMLLAMHGLTMASRAVCYACAVAGDRARADEDEPDGTPAEFAASDVRSKGDATGTTGGAFWRARANLLTPVAKAFATDSGFEVASLGVQVHGGMGFIEETGAAQHLRDARIAMIYEGTNGIQGIDLVTRKITMEGGEPVRTFVAELRGIAEEARASNRPGFGRTGERIAASLDDLEATTAHLLALQRDGRLEEALAGATAYLRLFALGAGGAYLAKAALRSDGDGRAAFRTAVARAFAERLCPQTAGLRTVIEGGAEAVAAVDAALLGEAA